MCNLALVSFYGQHGQRLWFCLQLLNSWLTGQLSARPVILVALRAQLDWERQQSEQPYSRDAMHFCEFHNPLLWLSCVSSPELSARR